jgi:methylthioribose-1-phosphate isomerase
MSTPEAADFSPLRFSDHAVWILDQTRLPREETWLECRTPEDVAGAIRRLSIRGAPAIGVAAAYGLAVAVRRDGDGAYDAARALLAATRPTAVNLGWALERADAVRARSAAAGEPLGDALLAFAEELHRDDIECNKRIGAHGARLFRSGDRVLTHCNTGALATAGYGTALGVIRAAYAAGHVALVWVDETRPLLQGARLTAWELSRLDIPFRLVTDSTAGALMARGLVDRVVVGADRIASNGDTANKVGTYTVAVLAHRHRVPFYIAAPRSTIDPRAATGADIPIEERDASEVTTVFGTDIAPPDTPALNLAFDVTPADLIAGIVTEVGILEPPFEASIAAALAVPGVR